MRFAALVCPALLILAVATARAHGPGNAAHPGGGHPSFAGVPGGGNGFKPGKFEGGPGFGDTLNALQNSSGNGKAGNPNFAELHPNAAGALKAAAANNATPLLANLATQGGGPAMAHHAAELLGFLEMAKNSSDPQVAARATQILQQFRTLAQQHGNLNQGGSTSTFGATANGASTNGFMPGPANHSEGLHPATHPAGHPTH